jgi:ribonucleotide monophosphatase NagD (HAD superfamily)
MNDLIISSLGHTWLIDIDGTICKHNGYKIDGGDTILPGVKTFLSSINRKTDKIIFLTSRDESFRGITEEFLKNNNIVPDLIIFGCPMGERILINDDKPSGLKMGIVVNLKRDSGFDMGIKIDPKK